MPEPAASGDRLRSDIFVRSASFVRLVVKTSLRGLVILLRILPCVISLRGCTRRCTATLPWVNLPVRE
jgi:hypothetical protein